MTTKLDFEQVIIHSFDDATGSLKVLTSAAAPTGTQPVSGSVSVTNFPATQAVSGAVTISNTVQTNEGSVFGNYNVSSVSIEASSGSYFEITSSTSSATIAIAVYDTTGASLSIATGSIGVETPILFTGPGDSGTYPKSISTGSRISIKSLEATAPGSGSNIIVRLIG